MRIDAIELLVVRVDNVKPRMPGLHMIYIAIFVFKEVEGMTSDSQHSKGPYPHTDFRRVGARIGRF